MLVEPKTLKGVVSGTCRPCLNWTWLCSSTRHLWHDVHLATLFFDKGAEVAPRSSYAETPLMFAAWLDRPQLVHILLSKGAAVNARTTEEQTALMPRCSSPLARALAKGATAKACWFSPPGSVPPALSRRCWMSTS